MTIEVAHKETIEGVKIEYLTDWDSRFAPKGLKERLEGYGKRVASVAANKGYGRVQIGSHGDLYSMGITKGRLVALDAMFVARFLKK